MWPHPHIKVVGGGGASEDTYFSGNTIVAVSTGDDILIFPPAAALASNHPTYSLLGFSAALAPKFPPAMQHIRPYPDQGLE